MSPNNPRRMATKALFNKSSFCAWMPASCTSRSRSSWAAGNVAFATLGEADRAALRADLVDLWASHNQASEPDRTIVDAEYLEVVGIRA